MPDRSHKVSARRRRLAALLGVFGLALIAAAPASAQEKILGAASYPDMSTYQCRTDAIPIYPGQNLNLFGLTKTCPNAVKVSGPGDASDFAPGSTAEGYVTRFQPSMVEVKERRQARHPERLGPAPSPRRLARSRRRPDLRLRRGEDDREDAAGLWVEHRRRRHLGPQLHDPQPRLVRGSPRLHHLGDRLGPGDEPVGVADRDHPDPLARRRRRPADLPGVRRRARLRHQRRRPVHLPRRGPVRPGGARLRGAREDQRRADLDAADRPHARLRRRPPAPGRLPRRPSGRARRPRPGLDRRRRPGRGPAAVSLRRSLLRARGRRSAGTSR